MRAIVISAAVIIVLCVTILFAFGATRFV